jgi:hypothetical protein
MEFFGVLPLRQAQGQDDSRTTAGSTEYRELDSVLRCTQDDSKNNRNNQSKGVSAAVHAEEAEEKAAEDGFDSKHEAGGRG